MYVKILFCCGIVNRVHKHLMHRLIGFSNLQGFKRVGMTKDYVAIDPRTGKPISFESSKKRAVISVARDGPWNAIPKINIIPLAIGDIQSLSVDWRGKIYTMTRKDGVEALSKIKGSKINGAHDALIKAASSDDSELRIAALNAMPEIAEQKSGELFDYLSVLLDDQDVNVSKVASQTLEIMAPVFPSGVEDSLVNELLSDVPYRSKAAWNGLQALCDVWPEVVCDHIDWLLQEDNPILRRKASKLLKRVVSTASSAAWDLISWSLQDIDTQVRINAANTLPSMVNREAKMAIIFAERALLDTDSKVRNKALQVLQRVDINVGRAKQIIIASTRHPNPEIRRNCIEMLDRILVEEEQRELAEDLLKTEKDEGIKEILRKLLVDISLEGTEAEKNRFLAPAEPVPAIDREVASAMGHAIGLLDENGNLRTTLPSANSQMNHDSINISRIPKEDQKHIKKARPTFNGVPIEDIDDDDDDFEDMYNNHYP